MYRKPQCWNIFHNIGVICLTIWITVIRKFNIMFDIKFFVKTRCSLRKYLGILMIFLITYVTRLIRT